MQAYCECKRSLAQKRGEDKAAPEAKKAEGEKVEAGNATNATNATAAPEKEVNLEDLKCNRPAGTKDLNCHLDG
jgi:hypothetical protein